MILNLCNHLWMLLTPLPLLGEASEPTVHQHLTPLWVVTNDPSHYLARDTPQGAGAKHDLLVVIHCVVAGVNLLHQPELVRAVGARGGGANAPCGTFQAFSLQPPDQADGAVHGGVPHLLHLGH